MSLPDLRPQARRRSPDELVAHLNSFQHDLKFSAGVWFFSPAVSRCHDRYTDQSGQERFFSKLVVATPQHELKSLDRQEAADED